MKVISSTGRNIRKLRYFSSISIFSSSSSGSRYQVTKVLMNTSTAETAQKAMPEGSIGCRFL